MSEADDKWDAEERDYLHEQSLDELRSRMEWQPIETAPKDGTQVVLANAVSVDVGSWQDEAPAAKESGVEVECGMPEGWWGIMVFFPDNSQPTHWMPLPEPPK